jgi:hypothetical protein
MVQKFRRRLDNNIEAIQFTGKNDAECIAFCPKARDPEDKKPMLIVSDPEDTLCQVGDFIVKRPDGVFVVIAAITINSLYEEVK